MDGEPCRGVTKVGVVDIAPIREHAPAFEDSSFNSAPRCFYQLHRGSNLGGGYKVSPNVGNCNECIPDQKNSLCSRFIAIGLKYIDMANPITRWEEDRDWRVYNVISEPYKAPSKDDEPVCKPHLTSKKAIESINNQQVAA